MTISSEPASLNDGGDVRPSFRVVLLHVGNHVEQMLPLPVVTDEMALDLAWRMAKDVAVELWDGERLIAHIEAQAGS